MYTREEDVRELENRYGAPELRWWEYVISAWEYEVVDGSMRGGRAHDVTLFIRSRLDPGSVAVISKHFFPPGAYRAPSGAARPGEGLEAGAIREALEETGLDVALTRYVARISAGFTCPGRTDIGWTSHVLEASESGGELAPIDTVEIAEARWATFGELQGPIRRVLLDSGWGLFRYRVALTDLAVETLGVRA